MIYGCHSDKAPRRCYSPIIYHSDVKACWHDKSDGVCQYDNKSNDIKCNGCKHEHKDDVSDKR